MNLVTRRAPRDMDLAELEQLNARVISIIGAPGSGKTSALSEFFRTKFAVLALDPTGRLAEEVEHWRDVEVWDLETDWRELDFASALVEKLRAKKKVVLNMERAPYNDAGAIADTAVGAARRAKIRDMLLICEEVQRIMGQSREGFSYQTLSAFEEGRNWRWGRIAGTQSIASYDKRPLRLSDMLFLGAITESTDLDAYRQRLAYNIPNKAELEATLAEIMELPVGRFVLRVKKHGPQVNE